jgi:hypothetical protein
MTLKSRDIGDQSSRRARKCMKGYRLLHGAREDTADLENAVAIWRLQKLVNCCNYLWLSMLSVQKFQLSIRNFCLVTIPSQYINMQISTQIILILKKQAMRMWSTNYIW